MLSSFKTSTSDFSCIVGNRIFRKPVTTATQNRFKQLNAVDSDTRAYSVTAPDAIPRELPQSAVKLLICCQPSKPSCIVALANILVFLDNSFTQDFRSASWHPIPPFEFITCEHGRYLSLFAHSTKVVSIQSNSRKAPS
jgi:hypothetical protein